jgi:hypothetical protein
MTYHPFSKSVSFKKNIFMFSKGTRILQADSDSESWRQSAERMSGFQAFAVL